MVMCQRYMRAEFDYNWKQFFSAPKLDLLN